jgi:assimilatory nitrate reductase catalytic subunit
LGVSAGEIVRVTSRRGSTVAVAFLTPAVQPGQVFLPMHFASVNQLTYPAFDPHSRQPSYKAAAVRVQRVKEM